MLFIYVVKSMCGVSAAAVLLCRGWCAAWLVGCRAESITTYPQSGAVVMPPFTCCQCMHLSSCPKTLPPYLTLSHPPASYKKSSRVYFPQSPQPNNNKKPQYISAAWVANLFQTCVGCWHDIKYKLIINNTKYKLYFKKNKKIQINNTREALLCATGDTNRKASPAECLFLFVCTASCR